MHDNGATETRKTARMFAFVVLLALGAHGSGVLNDFVDWDDPRHVTENPYIRSFRAENLRVMFWEPIGKHYMPLTWLSFALDYKIWGLQPFGFHLTNVLLHAANAGIVLLLLKRLGANLFVAAMAAAFFGVHPLRVESVAWVTERKDVLFGFFYLLGLFSYADYAKSAKRSRWWRTFLLFVAASLSKSAAITFPFVLLALDFYPLRRLKRGEISRLVYEKIPFLLVAVMIALAQIAAAGEGGGQQIITLTELPLAHRFVLVAYSTIFYLKKFVWPYGLSPIYPTYDEINISSAAIFEGTAFLFLLVVIVAAGMRARVVLACAGFFFLTLGPTSGIVPAGAQFMADRFLYLPSIALSLLVALGADWLLVRVQTRPLLRAAVVGGCGAVILWLALLAMQQTRVWHNSETLYVKVLEENPESLAAHINLMRYYTLQSRFDEAIECGRRAVELAPLSTLVHLNLGWTYFYAQRFAESVPHFEYAVATGADRADVIQAMEFAKRKTAEESR